MRQLSPDDASFLYADTLHANSNVTFVQIYDQGTVPGGKLRFKSILAHIQSRLHRSPIFRSKLLRVPFELDEPYWVEDEFFDLEHHVRHIALPKPGDWRQFCIQASRVHARALDLQRPLWEIYVVEGLDAIDGLPVGSFALLTKIHHAAIDVERRNEFIELLHDRSRRPPKPAPPQPWFPPRPPGALALLGRAGLHALASPTRLARPLLRALPKLSGLARELLQPRPHPALTRFNAVVSPHRVFETRRFRLDEFERIRGLVPGATVNDAVLAVCSGGLRRYLEQHAELPRQELDAVVPLCLLRARGPLGRSRQIGFGTQHADPLARLAALHAQTRAQTGAAPASARRAPACTLVHVPGPRTPVYLRGARLGYFSAILPISDGMGLVFAISDYDGRLIVSPTSCREQMPDPQRFAQCLRESFQEYLALTPGPAQQSASDTACPKARAEQSAAKPPRAAPAGRRRSTAPGR